MERKIPRCVISAFATCWLGVEFQNFKAVPSSENQWTVAELIRVTGKQLEFDTVVGQKSAIRAAEILRRQLVNRKEK